MFRKLYFVLLFVSSVPAFAQSSMPGMNMVDMNAASMDLLDVASGTSVIPMGGRCP